MFKQRIGHIPMTNIYHLMFGLRLDLLQNSALELEEIWCLAQGHSSRCFADMGLERSRNNLLATLLIAYILNVDLEAEEGILVLSQQQ